VHTAPVILTYHSQNILGAHAIVNDHEVFAGDLEALHASGRRIVSLDDLVDWLDHETGDDLDRCVCLTFDDGCDFDVRDIEWPGAGMQRSLLGIMRDFQDRFGQTAQPGLHATSFVIASPDARRLIDRGSLLGRGWMSDDWWASANDSGLMRIASHGWDHNHPDLGPGPSRRGGFGAVNDLDQCETQVIQAARFIESKTGRWPDLFAYPFGESSQFMRDVFFPGQSARHRCRAAFGTHPGAVDGDADRWNLPRLVCGRDWKTSQELIGLLDSL
jgi:peptidoglycan/xylan/chitin deacetylase (PgdA/CDA1 family)